MRANTFVQWQRAQYPAGMPDAPPPTLPRLFLGFLSVGMYGFGGVLPWARRMIVEQKRWLTAAEFTDMLGLCQFLPGGNIMNVTIALGARFHGVPGAVTAFAGNHVATPPGKRQVVVVVRERGGATVPAVFKSKSKSAARGFIAGRVSRDTRLIADEAG
jgi:hypothetical protein